MHLTRWIRIQFTLFIAVSLVAATVIVVNYLKLPAMLFGVGQYTVNVQLPATGGLYRGSNVTYRGVEVGRVSDVRLTNTGVVATMTMQADTSVPGDVEAAVHSQSSAGEQYIALVPHSGNSAPLKNGDVIPSSRTTIPPDINSLLDATNRGLQAIPHDNLKTVIDESYTAVGGLGPELARIVRSSTDLTRDANEHLQQLTTLIDQSPVVAQTQIDTSSSVRAWAANLATVTAQLKAHDSAVAGVIENGPGALDEARALFDRLQPTLPVLLANLVSVGKVAVAYQPNIEQILVLLPQGTANMQGIGVADRTQRTYRGAYLDFALNLNLPPPCVTGFLPAQQQRAANFEDYPERPPGDLYCRVPQDNSLVAVRGARNTPCVTVPGKRAPTAQMCESPEQYVPLNDGYNWKGDPNATATGQDIPQPRSEAVPPSTTPPPGQSVESLPAIAAVPYDPATGSYVAPDGRVYTQSNLAQPAQDRTWQSMLVPPGS